MSVPRNLGFINSPTFRYVKADIHFCNDQVGRYDTDQMVQRRTCIYEEIRQRNIKSIGRQNKRFLQSSALWYFKAVPQRRRTNPMIDQRIVEYSLHNLYCPA